MISVLLTVFDLEYAVLPLAPVIPESAWADSGGLPFRRSNAAAPPLINAVFHAAIIGGFLIPK